MSKPGTDRDNQDLLAALPLYAASLVVTLAGVGAVGVTVAMTTWTPVWVLLTVLGHGLSLWLRRMRLAPEMVFYPVMAAGLVLVGNLTLRGNPLLGVDQPLFTMPTDMATATIVGCLAVVRTFTLVTNGTLLFSAVPAITMLALVGSTNPNAEVPLFFGLLLLGGLFTTGYEAHLRRVAAVRRRPGSVLFHLLTAWFVTLGVSLAGLLFPVAVRPVMGPLSPFALPAVGQLNSLINFTQNSNGNIPVGQGPINLSPNPVFEVYTRSTDRLLRTEVMAAYSGRGWSSERQPVVVELESTERVDTPLAIPPRDDLIVPRNRYRFEFPPDPDRPAGTSARIVEAAIITRGRSMDGVPAFGRIRELLYPSPRIFAHASGAVSGGGHGSPDRVFHVVSEIAEFTEAQLRAAPRVNRVSFDDPETLALPQSTYPVQVLARELANGVATPYDQVRAFIGYIEKNCRYTLEEDYTPPGEDAAAHYLFTTRRGACDLSATALAVMCRAVGIPARVAVGFVAEEPLPDGGGFLVRQHHAHMWVETYFPGCGWVPFDPAPTLTDIRNHPLEVAYYRIQRMVARIGGGGLDALLFLGVVAITLLMLAYTGWKRLLARMRKARRERGAADSSPAVAVAMVYAAALRRLERQGWKREPWMTPNEYLDSVREPWASQPEAWKSLSALTEAYSAARYGADASETTIRAARDAATRLAGAAPRRPRAKREPGTGWPGRTAGATTGGASR